MAQTEKRETQPEAQYPSDNFDFGPSTVGGAIAFGGLAGFLFGPFAAAIGFFVGGAIGWMVDRHFDSEHKERRDTGPAVPP